MDTMSYFKAFVFFFILICGYEFYLKHLYGLLRQQIFIKFTLITVVFCCIQGLIL